jgi:hypothetical protein
MEWLTALSRCYARSVTDIPSGTLEAALVHLVGWRMTLRGLVLPTRCSTCGKEFAEVVAVARPRQRGILKNPY